jgi:hypothetical protein
MPEQPTYDDIQKFADVATDKDQRHLRSHATWKTGLGPKHSVSQHTD